MTTVVKELKASAGYSVKTVADRIADMDLDAQGNAEKAAWKRYMGYAMLGLAKGVSKKNMVAAVFGMGAKASKNFDNMWSLAEKARHNPLLLGNQAWDDVRAMGIDDALNATLAMINRHMSTLEVNGKNAYAPLAGMSLDEIKALKEQAEEAAKEEADAKAQADEAAKLQADEAEAKAQEEANAKAEPKSKPELAMAAMANATTAEIKDVIGRLSGMVDIDTIRELGALFMAMAQAHDAAEEAKLGAAKAEPIKKRA